MVRRIRLAKILSIVVASALAAFALGIGRTRAQSTSTAPNGGAPSPSASGGAQNRDAGERGRRGPGGGRFGGRERGGRASDNGNSDSSSPSSNTAAKPTPAPTTPAAPELSEADKVRAWAKGIIKKNDKNGDMMLQESEWEGLGQSTKADANGDKVITLDELVAYASRKPGSPASGPSPAVESKSQDAGAQAPADHGEKFVKPSSPGPSSTKSAKDKSKTYRFKTAKERLPAGLPSWFTSKDTNGDGQVSMSEYSKSWTESQAAEFKRCDRDNDGIITAEEAAKK
jgi:hypothetical protein